jgi:hypothetical protein
MNQEEISKVLLFNAVLLYLQKMMTLNIILYCLSCAGAAIPFALNNQMDEGGIFDYKVFKCAPCVSFWLAAIGLLFMGNQAVIFAGLAPMFVLFIHRFIS